MPTQKSNLQSLYAENTKVPVSTSIETLKDTLTKYGALLYYEGTDHVNNQYHLVFEIEGRQVRLSIPWQLDEQKRRQAFRVLLLLTKAQLESIALQMRTVDEAFMGSLMLSDGSTLGERQATVREVVQNMELPRLMNIPQLPEGRK